MIVTADQALWTPPRHGVEVCPDMREFSAGMGRRQARSRRNAGGSVAFSPDSIANLFAWWRGDSVGSPIDATKQSAWTDKTANGNTLVQGNALYQPTYTAVDAAYNNQPTLSFPSPGYMTRTFAATQNQPITIFCVGNTTLVGAGVACFYDGGPTGNPLFFLRLSATQWDTFGGIDGIFTSPTPDTAKHIITAQHNGASSFCRVDARSVNNIAGNCGANNPSGITVGGRNTAPTVHPLNGKLAELLIYTAALTLAQITAIVNYLSARYAIVVT